MAFAALFSLQASARNDVLTLDLEAAMSSYDAHQRLNQGVTFHFGESVPENMSKSLGSIKTSKKTNAFNKTDVGACQWAFLSAMLALQESALRKGGNAVVNIQSNYQNQPFASETQFNCGAGTFMAGVAFTGEVVKLTEK